MKKLILTFSLAAILFSAKAQTKVYYVNLNGKTGNEVSVAGGTETTVIPGNLIRGNGLSLWGGSAGSETETGASLANGFTSTQKYWDSSNVTDYATDSTKAVANNQYFEISFTVGAIGTGYGLNLATLRAKSRRTSGGSKYYMWKYSINGGGYNFIGSTTTLTTALGTDGNGVQQGDINLSGIAKLQNLISGTVVSFRIYNWSPTSRAGTFAMGRSLTSSENAIQIEGEVTLPVSLTAFNAKANKQGSVNLAWTTASEQNNSHFEVTRSTDGANFNTIDKVNGNGTSTSVNKYNYTDEKPIIGTNYYQLKQVDFDGKSAVSKVVSAKIGLNQSNIKVLANKTGITVNYHALANGKATFTVYSVSGAKLATVQQNVNAGANQFNIPVQLGNSLHLLKVAQGSESVSVKF